ncbi:alpha/beta hydrolase [Marilutibacter alkalisoli]|uniref:Alpha/beta hydrolase n=1 Tax=Marilutibacter alkalisoli TaxID=2591633 RepID=A0A514BND8_9GAMM|nr:alpha/beta hydrolase [Lysobacter alkalisoli]QDH68897.1 alpha/beta hydrolase [Lysobacter alkalisoli]
MAPTSRVILFACLLGVAIAPTPASAQQGRPSSDTSTEAASRIALWPGGVAPGSEGIDIEQHIIERSDDPTLPDRLVTGVTAPYMVVYRPPQPNGAALLVMPGGAYRRIVLDKEGTALVPEFVDRLGYTLFVLRYRLPGDGHDDASDAPLADAQRALRLIRSRADEWRLDPRRIGAIGFSAGGHVAASLGTRYGEALRDPVDDIDRIDARPDFLLLMYPVIDMGKDTHAVSREHLIGPSPSPDDVMAYSLQNRVHAGMPPAFLLHALDDASVSVANSELFFDALRRAGVPSELHLYPRGGHGFGTRDTRGSLALWPTLADAWIRTQVEDGQQEMTRVEQP